MTRYTCERMRAIEGGTIEGAARTFALRVARKKFGPKGECRSLYLRTDLGAIGASSRYSSGSCTAVVRR